MLQPAGHAVVAWTTVCCCTPCWPPQPSLKRYHSPEPHLSTHARPHPTQRTPPPRPRCPGGPRHVSLAAIGGGSRPGSSGPRSAAVLPWRCSAHLHAAAMRRPAPAQRRACHPAGCRTAACQGRPADFKRAYVYRGGPCCQACRRGRGVDQRPRVHMRCGARRLPAGSTHWPLQTGAASSMKTVH